MAKTFTAPFAQSPKTGYALVTAIPAAINTDSPSNTALLCTAGAEGCIVTRIVAVPRATVTATVLYLWLSKDGGTTNRLIDSALMAAWTVAATTQIPVTTFDRYSEAAPLRLEPADRLYVGIGVALAGGIVFKCESVDF